MINGLASVNNIMHAITRRLEDEQGTDWEGCKHCGQNTIHALREREKHTGYVTVRSTHDSPQGVLTCIVSAQRVRSLDD